MMNTNNIEVLSDRMAAVLREKSPAERLSIAHGMWKHARQMILSILRAEHPEWSEEEINQETARRLSHGAV